VLRSLTCILFLLFLSVSSNCTAQGYPGSERRSFPEGLENLALHKPVVACSEAADSPARYAVDGANDTWWRISTGQREVWLTVDLGEATKVNQFSLLTYGYPSMSGYRLQYSLDGEEWLDAYAYEGTVQMRESKMIPEVTGRYFRFFATCHVLSAHVGLRSLELYYDDSFDPSLMLKQVSISPVGFSVAQTERSFYDIVVPTGVDQVTIRLEKGDQGQRVTIDGSEATSKVIEFPGKEERHVVVEVTDAAASRSQTYTFILKRPPVESAEYVLLFADEFAGEKLDTDVWDYRTGLRQPHGGWNLPENVRVGVDADGNTCLFIDFKYEDFNRDGKMEYTGGGVISKPLFGYGYYEVRAKLYGESKGLHSSFWSMGADGNRNQVLEIDGFEVDSVNPDLLLLNGHWYVPSHERAFGLEYRQDTTEWFVMGYEWLPGRVNFYVNNQLVYSVPYDWLYAPQHLWLTALPTPDVGEGAVPPVEGAASLFDYFRYYARPLPGVNLLGNGSFEYNSTTRDPQQPVCWDEAGDAFASLVVRGDAVSGEYALQHTPIRGKRVITSQLLTFIPNGRYRLRAWTKATEGLAEAVLEVDTGDGLVYTAAIAPSTTWNEVVVEDVMVTNNRAHISIISAGELGQWLKVDDVAFELVSSQ